MREALFIALALAACDTPDLQIVYHVADGTSGPSCGTTSCADVPLECQSVLHLRILRPSDPEAPFLSICEPIPINGTKDMCAIGRIDLPRRELPYETLEVQVTVWPKDLVFNDVTSELDCGKVSVEFDATMGFPVAAAQNPAFGGRAFYHPGDTETVVTLGCVDVPSVNPPTCAGQMSVDVTATVGDFENLPFSVSSAIGDRLTVSIGEPKPLDTGSQVITVLKADNTERLVRTAIAPTPAWGKSVELAFMGTACIQVDEDGAATTKSLRCRNVSSSDTTLDLPGVRLPKATLDQVLDSLALADFPEAGMTVGIVLDNVGAPAAGIEVTATQGTVEYINATRNGTVTGSTSSSGLFVSRDAPYGTFFKTFMATEQLGGLVQGNVTVVILQLDEPIGG